MWGASLSCTQLAVLWVWQCRLSFVECRLLPATTINGIPTCLAACRLTGNFKNFNSQKFTGMRPFTCTRYVLVCPFVGNPVGSLSLPLSPPSLSLSVCPPVGSVQVCMSCLPAHRPSVCSTVVCNYFSQLRTPLQYPKCSFNSNFAHLPLSDLSVLLITSI